MAEKLILGKGPNASVGGWLRLGGFVVLVVVFVPTLLFFRWIKSPKSKDMPRLFHKCLLRLIGMRVRVHGLSANKLSKEAGPVLYVANHSSYLDIIALGSVIDGSFVAKSEVAGWPFIGQMARLQRTAFIERRAVRAKGQSNVLRRELEQGKCLILFPEGTSSDGMRTLPFKSSLFSAAETPLPSGALVQVQPVSILCTEICGMPIGRSWRPYYAWYGDMTLVKHVWDVFKIASFTVDVLFHAPVTISDFPQRKEMTRYCQQQITVGVDQCVTGRFEKIPAVLAAVSA